MEQITLKFNIMAVTEKEKEAAKRFINHLTEAFETPEASVNIGTGLFFISSVQFSNITHKHAVDHYYKGEFELVETHNNT